MMFPIILPPTIEYKNAIALGISVNFPTTLNAFFGVYTWCIKNPLIAINMTPVIIVVVFIACNNNSSGVKSNGKKGINAVNPVMYNTFATVLTTFFCISSFACFFLNFIFNTKVINTLYIYNFSWV